MVLELSDPENEIWFQTRALEETVFQTCYIVLLVISLW